MAPTLTKIRIYPIKSLDPVELEHAEVGVRALRHDREFAILAEDGRFINGKRTGSVNQLKAEYDLEKYQVRFSNRSAPEAGHSFHLLEDTEKIEAYLSDFFQLKVHFLHNLQGRLMDIPDVSGITILSAESLQFLSTHMGVSEMEDLRLRFRATLEISGVTPFWEERLALEDESGVEFQVGGVRLIGVSLRARCNVPPRNPLTGETDKSFVKNMIQARAANIPTWSYLSRLENPYHLSVNCFVPDSETGKYLHIGDEVRIV